MIIEAGKYYRTRENIKVLVIAVGLSIRGGKFNVVGLIEDDIRGWYVGTDEPDNNAYFLGRWNGNHPNDLVAEWVEPPTPLQVCQRIDELANEADAKITWPYMASIVCMARAAIAAAKVKP